MGDRVMAGLVDWCYLADCRLSLSRALERSNREIGNPQFCHPITKSSVTKESLNRSIDNRQVPRVRQDFDRDLATQDRVGGAPDLTHSPASSGAVMS